MIFSIPKLESKQRYVRKFMANVLVLVSIIQFSPRMVDKVTVFKEIPILNPKYKFVALVSQHFPVCMCWVSLVIKSRLIPCKVTKCVGENTCPILQCVRAIS